MKFEGMLSGIREGTYTSAKTKQPVLEHFFGVYDRTVGSVELLYDPGVLQLPVPGSIVEVECSKQQIWNFGKEIRSIAKSVRVIAPPGTGSVIPDFHTAPERTSVAAGVVATQPKR